ncbi:MAG: hypothetical protein ACC619_01450, partial [Paracoccaceae bacterium]
VPADRTKAARLDLVPAAFYGAKRQSKIVELGKRAQIEIRLPKPVAVNEQIGLGDESIQRLAALDSITQTRPRGSEYIGIGFREVHLHGSVNTCAETLFYTAILTRVIRERKSRLRKQCAKQNSG